MGWFFYFHFVQALCLLERVCKKEKVNVSAKICAHTKLILFSGIANEWARASACAFMFIVGNAKNNPTEWFSWINSWKNERYTHHWNRFRVETVCQCDRGVTSFYYSIATTAASAIRWIILYSYDLDSDLHVHFLYTYFITTFNSFSHFTHCNVR